MVKPRLLFVSFLLITLVHAQNYPVGHRSINFRDPTRSGGFAISGAPSLPAGATGRNIGTEVYYPATSSGDNVPFATGAFPLVVFGHGFAMTWDSYKTLTDSLVRNGYIVALPRTEGSILPPPSHLDFGRDLAKVAEIIAAQNSVSNSVFFGKHNGRTAIAGHSMGGGATFLADAYAPASVVCYFTFAAAETNPPASTAAKTITRPHLLFAGSFDCVTPPPQHQNIMWDSLVVNSCKTFINITRGYHCTFADYNFNCSFGESTCNPSGGLSATQHQFIVRRYLNPYLDYFLKGRCEAWYHLQGLLDTTTVATVQRVCNMQVPQQVAVQGNLYYCVGNSTSLTAIPSGFNYLWSTGATTGTITVNSPGSYYVKASNGVCEVTSPPVSIDELNPPSLSFLMAEDDTVCSGDTLTFFTDSLTGVQYFWNYPSGWSVLGNITGRAITLSPSTNSGFVSVYAQNPCGNSNTVSVPVIVRSVPIITDTLQGDLHPCENLAQATYSIGAAYFAENYLWSFPTGWNILQGNGTTTVSAIPGSSGIISVASANDCGTGPAVMYSVSVKELPKLTGNIAGPEWICKGENNGVVYTVTPTISTQSYVWIIPSGWSVVSGGQSNSITVNPLSSGTISVTASNECGASEDTLYLSVTVADTPIASITLNGATLNASPTGPDYTYQWYYNGSLMNENSSAIQITNPGVYDVKITDLNTGCSGSASAGYIMISSLKDIENLFNLTITQTDNFIRVQTAFADERVILNFYDTSGRCLHSQLMRGGIAIIPTGGIGDGVYLIAISTGMQHITRRIVIQR
ncbi:MAG: hypothetical protein NZM35_03345 [Chitinophagales bacterium]|nr:hypothetical protein [Chitinophagales bacterium]MDW8419559.1 hypothetical protein [Chitinophagales bacterium]